MRLTEKKLGGWSLLLGTAAVGVGYALSPGRGAVDTVPSTSLTDLTLAMARNQALSYTVPVVIICGALLMLGGLLTLRRHTDPVPQLGLLGMAIGLVLQMVMRGLDYMITGMGVAALESSADRSEAWLQSALEMQRLVFGLQFTSIVVGFIGAAIMALGLAFRPEPLLIPPALNGIVAVLALAALGVFIAAWHSNTLELAVAPVFAAMSVGGIAYMGLLGWKLIASEGKQASKPQGKPR
ncbi:MAG: hypothetical protein OXC98_10740 [bacterium]|nr:hypothetical protein [Acidimicrobiia bacterium]MCY4650826.1 hypothetical protein [bacterium]